MYIHVGMECSWRHMCVELGPRPCICALLWFLAWWHKVTDWWCGGISEGIRTCTCTHRTQYCRCGAYAFYLSIQIWSLTTKPDGRLLNDLALHVDWVNCVLYSPSGHHILSAGDNGIIKVRIKLITSDFYELIMYIHLWTVSRFCGMKTRMRVRSSQSWMDHLFRITTADLLYILQRVLRDMSLLLCATFPKIQGYR